MGDGSGKTCLAWFGGGCIVLILLGGLVLGGGGYAACRAIQGVVETQQDPELRTKSALEALGAEALPEGYFAVGSIGVGPFFKMIVLSDRRPGPDGELSEAGKRGFFFIKVINRGSGASEKYAKQRAFFLGEEGGSGIFRHTNLRIDPERVERRGRFAINGGEVLYLVQRGSLDIQKESVDGLSAVLFCDCGETTSLRIGIWFAPDPDPEGDFDALDLTGTPADEAAIVDFIGGFHLCN